MNAAEHIVDAYFRLCRKCFTLSDLKVEQGNNRQFALLAHDLANGESFHIEVGVTHRPNWCPTVKDLESRFDKKFFGAAPQRDGASTGRTDHERKKNYFEQIEATYRQVGIDPAKVKRVWVCWLVKGCDTSAPLHRTIRSDALGREFDVEILGLRDLVLPKLQAKIGTSNYEDEVLRTLGFLKQSSDQKAATAKTTRRPSADA
ncbi:hypothetical protein RO575_08375 [Methylomonas sp. MO1]|uniref:hypothetical protein n=1 Tax=Methylomonas sp. MO1 TaxID=3073619 RepID=UPI0028A4F726|nr:hypothetical protein [Methylomonas sp. MO1]MDT4289572.1 hypothetical protein [Methylomonas sp. MO1]